MRVGSVCTRDPVTVDIDSEVVAVARLMRQHHVGDVVVLENGSPVGIVTDRDLAIGVVAQAPDKLTALVVRDVLTTTELHTVHQDEPVWKTLKRMRDRGVRRMPVVDEGRLVGIFTFDDALGLLVEQLGDLAALLEGQSTREFFERR